MSDRLQQKPENAIVSADIVDGKLIIRRYDGSTLGVGSETAESDRLVPTKENNVLTADIVDGELIIKRHDGSSVGSETATSDRLIPHRNNSITAGDVVDGEFILKRYDGSTIKYSEGEDDPYIIRLSPEVTESNGDAISIGVFGSRFTPDAVVELNQVAVVTTYSSQGALIVPSWQPGAAGDVEVTVRQGEQESNSVFLSVADPPTLASVAPNSVPLSLVTSVMLTFTGTRFTPTTRASMPYAGWEGGTSAYVSDTQLTYTFMPDLAGTGDVGVIDDDNDLGSNRLPFTITAAVE